MVAAWKGFCRYCEGLGHFESKRPCKYCGGTGRNLNYVKPSISGLLTELLIGSAIFWLLALLFIYAHRYL